MSLEGQADLPGPDMLESESVARAQRSETQLQNPDHRFNRIPPGIASRSRPSTRRRTDRSAQVALLIMQSEHGCFFCSMRHEHKLIIQDLLPLQRHRPHS